MTYIIYFIAYTSASIVAIIYLRRRHYRRLKRLYMQIDSVTDPFVNSFAGTFQSIFQPGEKVSRIRDIVNSYYADGRLRKVDHDNLIRALDRQSERSEWPKPDDKK
jgi:hypothetical protein